uniref:Uncharacterized protein n=1 Tax=Arion vulgaris TaxID=1028688 RepID=A0A0B7ASS5_9EUPU
MVCMGLTGTTSSRYKSQIVYQPQTNGLCRANVDLQVIWVERARSHKLHTSHKKVVQEVVYVEQMQTYRWSVVA